MENSLPSSTFEKNSLIDSDLNLKKISNSEANADDKKAVAIGFLVTVIVGISIGIFYFSQPKKITLSPTSSPSISTVHSSPTPSAPTTSLPTPPVSKILPGGTHTFQTFNNCGPAALSMALSHYGITVSQQTLGQALRPYQQAQGDNDDKSVTLEEVAAKAEEFGLIAYRRPAGNMDIITQFIAADIPVITRTWLRPNEDIGHYRVIKGYNQTTQTIIQDDSLQGKDLNYSYDDFQELWAAFNYEFLVLVPAEKKVLAEHILGELVDEKQAWQKSLEIAQQDQANNSNDIYAVFNQSVALYYLGQYQESVERYEQVANRLPARMLWYQLEPILAYYKLEKYDTVMTMSNAILTNQNRAYAELYYLQGLIYQQRNQVNEAETAFAAANRYNQSEYWRKNLP